MDEYIHKRRVEFRGGPMDGLILVNGIDPFFDAAAATEFSVDNTGTRYARKSPIVSGKLVLDVVSTSESAP